MKKEKLIQLIDAIEKIIAFAENRAEELQDKVDAVDEHYKESATNLIHYLSVRSFNISKIQKQLGLLGLSRFARAEAHILRSLYISLLYLKFLLGEKYKMPKAGLSIKETEKLIRRNTKALLGYRKKGRRVRIMVTLPSVASHDATLVYNFAAVGMNCARINCAHDDQQVWKAMIDNVKVAAKRLGKNIKITMDLGGPKIRTGQIEPGPKVRKISPVRDDWGRVVKPATVHFVPAIREEEPNDIPVPLSWMANLKEGDVILFQDTRNKKRDLVVTKIMPEMVLAEGDAPMYFETGMTVEANGSIAQIGELPEKEHFILLNEGDHLILHEDKRPGQPAVMDENLQVIQPAHVSCSLPELFPLVKKGDPIFFDDGKIQGQVLENKGEEIVIKICRAKRNGSKLRADKGINLPASNINIHGLTEKDKEDLPFIVEHADVVNFSFVNTPEDVAELHDELIKLEAADKMGVILKIETYKGFRNLPKILLEAMKMNCVGVMIARGDLAVEVGWEDMGWVQREILAICSAAHIPVVWATQVLEGLAKKGLPSRSEITDATQSLKAECVMLNKGAYIVDAIILLDTILAKLEKYQSKGHPMLPALPGQ